MDAGFYPIGTRPKRAGHMTRVCFNGRFLGRPVTGVERFAGETIRAIDALCAEENPATAGLEFEIIRPKGAEAREGFAHVPERTVGTWAGHLWEQIDLPRHLGDGILVNLCNSAPFFGTQSVTCVHDANVFLIPESYSLAFRTAYRAMLPLVIRRSSRWITVSAYSATQLARLGISNRAPNAIVANGVEHIGRLQPRRSRLAATDLPRRFVLALGSRSRNKNLDLLIEISADLQAAGVSIVLAGAANCKIFGGSDAKERPNVIELGRVTDEDIAYLYSSALCFAFPSLYEGFGIPAIEAMACGCPVIAANTSALPEVLGDAALFCSPTDPRAWRSAILRLAADADLCNELALRGRACASRYSWRAAALRLLDVVRPLAEEEKRSRFLHGCLVE
jgi:glycosyltransferase involved in cell wall biosynthesis